MRLIQLLCFSLHLVALLIFFSTEIHIHSAKDVSLQPHLGNSLPFKRELVLRVDEGSAQICFPSSPLSTDHRNICITFL